MVMMMVVMVMVGMNYHHHLRLRRIRHCDRYCDAEDENGCKQKLFHAI